MQGHTSTVELLLAEGGRKLLELSNAVGPPLAASGAMGRSERAVRALSGGGVGRPRARAAARRRRQVLATAPGRGAPLESAGARRAGGVALGADAWACLDDVLHGGALAHACARLAPDHDSFRYARSADSNSAAGASAAGASAAGAFATVDACRGTLASSQGAAGIEARPAADSVPLEARPAADSVPPAGLEARPAADSVPAVGLAAGAAADSVSPAGLEAGAASSPTGEGVSEMRDPKLSLARAKAEAESMERACTHKPFRDPACKRACARAIPSV